MRMIETTRVVGWPMTSAGLMPMEISRPLNRLATSSRVASEMGLSPSMKRPVMRGISSITAPILMPRPRMPGIPSTKPFQLSQARMPMPQPTMTPMKRGSPSTPKRFFMPSASMLSLSIPGILSRHQLMPSAKGTKPWTKGWGMEMPSRLS